MRSLTFTLDTQTGGTDDPIAPATVTITEQLDGTLLFTIDNLNDADNQIGDIRALFFDVSNDNLLGTLSVSGDDVTEFVQDGDVSNMGNGATSSGVPDSPYEVGVEIGTAGAAENDIQTTSFVLSTSLEGGLTLDDIALESFFVRQTSVGDADGSRDGSDKLYGDAPYPVNAIDDVVDVTEDTTVSGNVFANDIDEDAGDADNDGIPDRLTVVAVNGDGTAVGASVPVGGSNSGVTITIAADGSYIVNAEDADHLAEGETFSDTVTYSVDDGNGGSDTATITVNVTGVNDEEVITGGDASGAVTELPDGDPGENIATLSDSGTLDFIDADLSDTHTVSVSAQGTDYLGAFTAEMTADTTGTGTGGQISWNFTVNDALLDSLAEGEQLTQYYDVLLDDGMGSVSTQTVAITITGAADDDGNGGGDGEDHFGTFTNKKGTAEHAISNVVLYLQDGDDIIKAKIDGWDGMYSDLDDVNLTAFLDREFADAELIGVSIKAGNNHNADLGPGEGQFFLLDGDEGIDYQEGGTVPEPLTLDILGAKADVTYDYDASLFV